VSSAKDALALLTRGMPDTLGEFIKQVWIPARREALHVAGSTLATDLRRARRILVDSVYAGLSMRAVTARECQAFVDRLARQGLAPTTIEKIVALLKMILSEATDEGWIERNPIAIFSKSPKIPKLRGEAALAASERRMKRFWEPDLVGAYFALEAAFEILPEDYVLFAIMLILGLRPGEACAIRWEDFLSDFTSISVSRAIAERHERDRINGASAYEQGPTKSGSAGRVPIPEPLALLLRRYARETGKPRRGLMFINKYGNPLTPGSLRDRWRTRAKRADGTRYEKGFYFVARAMVSALTKGAVDLHYITPYGQRHTCAVFILQFASPEDAAEALRHAKSTGTTLIYRNYGEILDERRTERATNMGVQLAERTARARRHAS